MKVKSGTPSIGGVKKTAKDRVKNNNNNNGGGGKTGKSGKSSGWRKAVHDEIDSHVSDLSDSTEDNIVDGPTSSLAENSEDYENFEKMLRSKHSKACKAMSVSTTCVFIFFVKGTEYLVRTRVCVCGDDSCSHARKYDLKLILLPLFLL